MTKIWITEKNTVSGPNNNLLQCTGLQNSILCKYCPWCTWECTGPMPPQIPAISHILSSISTKLDLHPTLYTIWQTNNILTGKSNKKRSEQKIYKSLYWVFTKPVISCTETRPTRHGCDWIWHYLCFVLNVTVHIVINHKRLFTNV